MRVEDARAQRPPSPPALRWPESQRATRSASRGRGGCIEPRSSGLRMGCKRGVNFGAFVFAQLARTIGASDHKEASCLGDRAEAFVCKIERRLAGVDGYGWLRGRQECL